MDAIFQRLNNAKARYLLIGGQAMRLYGMPRFSMDWDLFIPARDLANLELINHLLDDELELPLLPLGPHGQYFLQTEQISSGILQFHLLVPGLSSFEEAENRACQISSEHGVPISCLSPEDLLKSKQAANRAVDQQDILFLTEKLKQSQKPHRSLDT